MHMANAYWLIGKWSSAETEFKAELAIDPNNCSAHWKLANSILEANDSNDEALAELDQSIRLCPTLMQARVDRARALIRLGRHAEALPELQLAVAESPNEPTIHFLLASVYRVQAKGSEAQQEMQLYRELQRVAAANVAAQAKESTNIKTESH